MPLHQRCPKCRAFTAYEAKVCQRCGEPLPKPKETWLIKWDGKKRKFKSLGRVTKMEAMMELEALTVKVKWGVEDHHRKLKDVFDAYETKLKAEGKKYHTDAHRMAKRMLEILGNLPVERISFNMIKELQVKLRADNSPAYCDRHIAIGKAAWTYAADPKLANPFKAVKMYNPDNKIVRWLSQEEEQKLLEMAPKVKRQPFLRQIILIAIHTGLRRDNILKLHISEVFLEEGIIRLRQKGNRSLTIPINSVVQEALSAITPGPEGYYFTNKRTGKPYHDIKNAWDTVKTLAEITRPFRFHDLRHHCATMVGRLTNNPRLIQKLLGHGSFETTERYMHTMVDDVRAAVDLLAERQQPKPQPGAQGVTQPSEDISK